MKRIMGLIFAVVVLVGYGTAMAGTNAVAYLVDAKGDIKVISGNVERSVKSLCDVVSENDSVKVGEKSAVTVMQADRWYILTNAGSFRIEAVRVMGLSGTEEKEIAPSFGSRSGGSLPGDARVVSIIPPPNLFAAVKPALSRASGTERVLLPRGVISVTDPDIVWTGESNRTWTVRLYELEDDKNKEIPGVVRTNVCSVAWNLTPWSSLKRGGNYRMVLEVDGKVASEKDHSFTVMSEKDYSGLAMELAAIDRAMPEGFGRTFAKACLYSNEKWRCWAEGRRMAVQLLKEDRDNPVLLRLMMHCYAAMDIPEGVASVDARLQRLGKGL